MSSENKFKWLNVQPLFWTDCMWWWNVPMASCLNKKEIKPFPINQYSVMTMWERNVLTVLERGRTGFYQRHKSRFSGPCHQSWCDGDISCWLLRSRHPQRPFILTPPQTPTRLLDLGPSCLWSTPPAWWCVGETSKLMTDWWFSSLFTAHAGLWRLKLDLQQQRMSWRGQHKFDVGAPCVGELLTSGD